jgi:hypothetical protein
MRMKMDLKEFVKLSLVQISEGIEDANNELKNIDAMVNPLNISEYPDSSQIYARTENREDVRQTSRIVEKVEFNVAVIVESGKKGSAGAKLSIASIGIGADGKLEYSNKSESRIKFSVPVVFPGVDNQS